MILNTKYPLPVQRPTPKTLVQPDDMIGEHRAGENSPSSEYDPSPRRAAVDTGSEEPGTLLKSPAISTGSGFGASQAETQNMKEEGTFSFETSMDGFLRSNCTSTEQECNLLQSDVGVNDATTQQATVCEEFVTPTEKRQGTTAWATEQHKQFDRGRSL